MALQEKHVQCISTVASLCYALALIWQASYNLDLLGIHRSNVRSTGQMELICLNKIQ